MDVRQAPHMSIECSNIDTWISAKHVDQSCGLRPYRSEDNNQPSLAAPGPNGEPCDALLIDSTVGRFHDRLAYKMSSSVLSSVLQVLFSKNRGVEKAIQVFHSL